MGCQLADELASGFGLHASASEHCIDVLADGFAFRIFLTSERCDVSALPLWVSCSVMHLVFMYSFCAAGLCASTATFVPLLAFGAQHNRT